MVALQVRRIVYEEAEFEPDDVMALKEAAQELGMTLAALITAVDRCRLTELVDPDAVHAFRRRRFVLRSEVQEMAEKRQRAADKWG